MRAWAIILASLLIPACSSGSRQVQSGPPSFALETMPEGFTGVWTTYYPDGTPESVSEFKDGVVCGSVTEYSTKGNIRSTYTVKDGKRTGTITVYYDDGTVRMKYSYIDGKSRGRVQSFYPGGQPLAEVTPVIPDRLEVTFYHENGSVSERYTICSGLPDGPYTSYYEDGTLRRTGNYNAGEMVGAWTYREPDGKICVEQY